MPWSSSEALEIIEPYCPQELVPATPFVHSKALAALFPRAISSCYWECRLTEGMSQVDFLTCVAASDRGREILAGRDTGVGLPTRLLRHALWACANDFLQQWAEPTSFLYDSVPLIWMEFDHVDCPQPEVPLPSFSFCVDPLYAERRSWEQYVNARNPQRRRQAAEKGLVLLFGNPPSLQCRNTLATCFDALPAGGQIIYISAMVGRQPAVAKLYGSVPREQLFPYLTQIGWPGSIPELTDILATYCTSETVDHTMFIDLSFGDTVLPKLGIAFAQQQIDNLPSRDPTRQASLDLCVSTGLCTPEKRDALLAWPGTFHALFRGEQWPSRFRKWLDVKLVYQPDQPIEAKGYLGFSPYFSLF